jgi:hypothetical protein
MAGLRGRQQDLAITGSASRVDPRTARRKRVGMTSERARAHTRVMKTLRNVGPAKLLPAEQARIRSTADSLLFCADIMTDRAARAAFSDFDALCEHVVGTGRWSARRAAELADDVWACGPGLGAALQSAA